MVQLHLTMTRNLSAPAQLLVACTLLPDLVHGAGPSIENPSPDWVESKSIRLTFQEDLLDALAHGKSFPAASAAQMGTALMRELIGRFGDRLLAARRAGTTVTTKIVVDDHTWYLLPELCVVGGTDGEAVCLDDLGPCWRSHSVTRKAVRRPPDAERSLAILVDSSDPAVVDLADRLADKLFRLGVRVDTFPGNVYAEMDPTRRLAELRRGPFRGHRGLLFLGHMRNGADRNASGWRLAGQTYLSHAQILSLLGHGADDDRFGGPPLPELVVANACFSAGGQLDGDGHPGPSFAKDFLARGVSAFVATPMNVVLTPAGIATTQTFLTTFLDRWAADPARPAEHLYAAKQACDRHPLTKLYQIYCAGGVPAPDPQPRPSLGPVADSVRSEVELGPYSIGRLLWEDPYGSLYEATHRPTGEPCFVQVLADELQGDEQVLRKLRDAVGQLTPLQTGSVTVMVPTADLVLPLAVDSATLRELHFLAYARPDAVGGETWHRYEPHQVTPDAEGFAEVLDFGRSVAAGLRDLHAVGLAHGNLHPGNLVYRDRRGRRQLLLKDPWLSLVAPGRCTRQHYAAPEEPGERSLENRCKDDCWALGVLMYQMLTGGLPSRADRVPDPARAPSVRAVLDEAAAAALPDALEHITRRCLMPAAALRPSADEIVTRLDVAARFGGKYVGPFLAELDRRVAQGHRLFAVPTDDPARVERVFRAHGRADLLYVVAADGDPVREPLSARSVVLIEGGTWWHSAPPVVEFLRRCQAEPESSPTVVVADSPANLATIPADLDERFCHGLCPLPDPAEVFEHILAFAEAEDLLRDPLLFDSAIDLAAEFSRLLPCLEIGTGLSDLADGLRGCLRDHGTIDRRALQTLHQVREQRLERLGTADYAAPANLPAMAEFGTDADLDTSLRTFLDAIDAAGTRPIPPLLIAGPPGCGKTALCQAMARRLCWPLIEIRGSACVRDRLAESAAAMRLTLTEVSALGRAVVLLENVDRFCPAPDRPALPGLGRLVLDWLDRREAMPGAVVLATVDTRHIDYLTPEWRRRFPNLVRLAQPVGDAGAEYRQAVFRGVFAAANLDELASDSAFIEHLARATDPRSTAGPRSPVGRLAGPGSELYDQRRRLDSCAAIKEWVLETVALHASRTTPGPEDPAFWEHALE